jgi:hypothetical protein
VGPRPRVVNVAQEKLYNIISRIIISSPRLQSLFLCIIRIGIG